MSIESIVAASTAGSTVGADRQLIADNLDTFLQLLTTQLKNQNPLDPLDTNQFTQQLVEFSSVEQAVKTNDLLTGLLASSAASATSTAVSYIGKAVEASGATTTLKSDEAAWTYQVDADAPEAGITIRDASGAVVFSDITELKAGTHGYSWDGTRSGGGTAPEGLYTITIDAKDADGRNLKVSTTVRGEVTGVEFDGTEPVLMVGTSRVNLSSVKSVTSI
jgi:flagellar basal-body rod modification protein FlgD